MSARPPKSADATARGAQSGEAVEVALRELLKALPNTVDLSRLLQFSGLDDVPLLQRKLVVFDHAIEQARAALGSAA